MELNAPWLFILFESGIPLVKFGTVNLEQKAWMLSCLLGKIFDSLGRSQAKLMSAAVIRVPRTKVSPGPSADVMARRENLNINVLTDSDLVFRT